MVAVARGRLGGLAQVTQEPLDATRRGHQRAQFHASATMRALLNVDGERSIQKVAFDAAAAGLRIDAVKLGADALPAG
jgi:hypothetical protein